MLLIDKIAIITGGASIRGIGKATAHLFAENGAKVVILDIDEDAVFTAAEDLGSGHYAFSCDVTKKDECLKTVELILQKFKTIDILVNNAGITQPLKTLDISEENYQNVLDVSLKGMLLMSQAVLPTMKKNNHGSIINMSSVSAQRGGGIFGGAHYSAAKSGMLGMSKAMARELGAYGIRINSIAPGLIDTDITQGKLDSDLKQKISTINEIKEKFDIILLFGVLYHLPNPVMVLKTLANITHKMLLISSHIIDSKEPVMYYYPEGSLTPGDTTNWWVPTPSCLTDIGRRLGFNKSKMVDTFDFDSMNSTLEQTEEVKNGIRRIHKVGLFKMEK